MAASWRPTSLPAPRLLLIAVVALLVLLSTVFRESSVPLLHSATKSPSANPYRTLNVPTTRQAHNLIYWTPRKTGSTSTREWLQELARVTGLRYRANGVSVYVGSEDYSLRVGNKNCSIFAGHILINDIHSRPHEAEQGAVVTTTRDVYSTLVSKYYSKTRRKFAEDLRTLVEKGSAASKIWYHIWLENDPCEPMRYYDGLRGCCFKDLEARAEAIAERMDCVIDIEDPEPDVKAICNTMKVTECPKMGVRNVLRGGSGQYDELLKIPHLKERMKDSADALQILRDALMKRLCRSLLRGAGDNNVQSANMEMPPAKWPTPQCKLEAGSS